MSINIPTFYVEQFSSNVELLSQQKDSRFAAAVSHGSYVGKAASVVDQVGAIEMQPVVSRFAPMGRVDAPTDRRWVFPSDFDLPQLIDSFDKLRLITDPTSAYVQNAVAARNRKLDDIIISAFFADAKTGEQGATTTSFDSNNVISVDTGGSASGLNVAKLRAARKRLRKNLVDLEAEPMFCAITAEEEDDLLNEYQVISREFNEAAPVLQDGRLSRFMGFNFLYSERLTTGTDDQSGSSTAIPAWVPSGMHLGMWGALQNSVDQRADLQGKPFQLYTQGTFGATRVEEAKVIKVWCR